MSVENETQQNDERQILALHEAGDRALMSADLDVLARIFADDYVQYNEAGIAFTRQDVLNNFRTGAIRYPSIVSTGRSGGQRKAVRRALRLPRRPAETRWRVEISGIAVGAAGR
jgi:Domain of unknown function (DUF4440)